MMYFKMYFERKILFATERVHWYQRATAYDKLHVYCKNYFLLFFFWYLQLLSQKPEKSMFYCLLYKTLSRAFATTIRKPFAFPEAKFITNNTVSVILIINNIVFTSHSFKISISNWPTSFVWASVIRSAKCSGTFKYLKIRFSIIFEWL